MAPNDNHPDGKEGCISYLMALNGQSWLKMSNKDKAYEWDRLMSMREIRHKRIYDNPWRLK